MTDINSRANSKPELVVLIDANALIHRAFHAFPTSLTTRDGELTNAVFGFSSLLLETLKKFGPRYVVACFDMKGPTLRHQQYKEYKAHRKPMDPELAQQFPRVREVVKAMNIPIFELAGYEADDLIGTLATAKIPTDLEKVIVTGDQDILQLVSDEKKISVYMAGSSFSQSKLYHENEVQERYGFAPLQIIDYKSLLGDPSDNIPGVPGIGKKGATDLIQQFTTVHNVYSSIEKNETIWQEKPWTRVFNKLVAGKDSAMQSYELATINTAADVEFTLSDAELGDYSREEVINLFQKLEFRTLVARLPKSLRQSDLKAAGEGVQEQTASRSAKSAKSTVIKGGSDQGDLFAAGEATSTAPEERGDGEIKVDYSKVKYELINDAAEAVKRLQGLLNLGAIGFDTEADDLDYMKAKITGLAFATDEGAAFFLPELLLQNSEVKAALQTVIDAAAEGSLVLVAHNLKYDLHILANIGIEIANTSSCFDTLLAAYILQGGEGFNSRGLKDLAFSHFGMIMENFEDLVGTGRDKLKITEVAVEKVANYCCADTDACLRLYGVFAAQIAANENLKKIFREIEMPMVKVLIDVEREGMFIDQIVLDNLGVEARDLLAKQEKAIYDEVGHEFNIGSPKQVAEVLFGELKLQEVTGLPVSKTKSGAYSTDERTLMNFAKASDLVHRILNYREISKLLSTYIDALGKIIDAEGKVHTSYNQAVAATGRLSSNNPNLQNIPVSSKLGSRIREAFSAGVGRKLLAFDYAQQELRLLAHLSGEEKLIEAFQTGVDIHTLTASEILNIPLDQVDKDARRVGKTVNFGVVYGISPFGLSDRLKIEQKQAKEFITAFFAKYPKIEAYFKQLKSTAMTDGEIYTLMGRRRDASGLKSSNFHVRAAVEREIINFPLQGSAADVMKLAMIKLHALMTTKKTGLWPDLKLHLQIHDELVFSIPVEADKSDLKALVKEIKDLMRDVVDLKVPLLVDAEMGNNWYDLKALDDND